VHSRHAILSGRVGEVLRNSTSAPTLITREAPKWPPPYNMSASPGHLPVTTTDRDHDPNVAMQQQCMESLREQIGLADTLFVGDAPDREHSTALTMYGMHSLSLLICSHMTSPVHQHPRHRLWPRTYSHVNVDMRPVAHHFCTCETIRSQLLRALQPSLRFR
jgi:hypothetical protein